MFSLSHAKGEAKAAQSASKKRLKAMQKASQAGLHPLAAKAKAASKAPALPGGKPPKGIVKGKGYTFTMGKLSLITVALSLMFFGSLTFFSGFMVGSWYRGPSVPQMQMAAPHLPAGLTASGQPQQPIPAQFSPDDPGLTNRMAQEAKKLGLGHIAGASASYQVQTAVESSDIPGVPNFLKPFVEQVKQALGHQAGSAAGRAVQGGVQKAATPATRGLYPGGPAHPEGSKTPGGASDPATSPHSGRAPHTGAPSSPHAGSGKATSAAHSPKYAVQLGAYVARENAETMVHNLKMKSFAAYVTPAKEHSGHEIYYVRVGHYDDYGLAHTVALNFIENNIPGATIVKLGDDKKH